MSPDDLLDNNPVIHPDEKDPSGELSQLWESFCDWFLPDPADPAATPPNPDDDDSPYTSLMSALPTSDLSAAQIIVALMWDAFSAGSEMID